MKPKEETNSSRFFVRLAGPAQRALENAGIFSVMHLANLSKSELLKLHGMGSVPKLEKALQGAGLSFKNEQ